MPHKKNIYTYMKTTPHLDDGTSNMEENDIASVKSSCSISAYSRKCVNVGGGCVALRMRMRSHIHAEMPFICI